MVIADTGPLYYLVLVDAIDILPRLFGTVAIPPIVAEELCHPKTPGPVRAWIGSEPAWLREVAIEDARALPFPALDQGERAVLGLADSLTPNVLLIDDRRAVHAASMRGFAAVGTLGLLDRAARLGLLDLATAMAKLRRTNFRCRPALMDEVLTRYEQDKRR